jgi:diaminohydroxyphosphoribosylaminopyrimidine deaminase/5-amino-6-(5-phosphoribosylamino)uracil reductase
MGVQSVLLEGGNTLAGEFLRNGLIDKFLLFYAPKILGGRGPGLFSGDGVGKMMDAIKLRNLKVRKFGADLLIEGYPEG